MTALRVVGATLGLAATAAGLLLDRPTVLAVFAAVGLLLVIVGTGSAAADALPLRPAALACSVATVLAGLLLLLGTAPQEVVGVGVALLQVVPAVLAGLRAA